MLGRVTAGEVLERVVEALADMRSPERLLGIILTETLRMLDAQGAYMLWLVGERLALRASAGLLPPGREDGLAVGEHSEVITFTSPQAATPQTVAVQVRVLRDGWALFLPMIRR